MNAESAKLVPVSAGLEAATLSLDGRFADFGGLSGARRHVQTFFLVIWMQSSRGFRRNA
jgi:hypothetical protein